jgi:hypothetical protein
LNGLQRTERHVLYFAKSTPDRCRSQTAAAFGVTALEIAEPDAAFGSRFATTLALQPYSARSVI